MIGVSRSHTGGARRRDEGFALITAMAFLVFVLSVGTCMVQQAIQELHSASRAKKETRAFNLAEAGIDYGAWMLYTGQAGSLPATWTKSDLPYGSFTVTADHYDGSSEAIILTSTGTSEARLAEVKVVGEFLGTGSGGQNPVFEGALFSDADLTLSGNFDIIGDVHGNGKVTVRGNVDIDGDLSAGASLKLQGNPNITGDVTPYVDTLAMPTIDLEYYRSIATREIDGDYTLSGNTQLDGVIFIDGDVHISGNFSGQGVIVATGDVHINGNATVQQAGDEFAIVSAGSVRINGNCTIEGWIYTHNMDVPGLFHGNGNADIVGGVAADIVQCNGNMDIEYRPSTLDLPGSSTAPAQFDGISWWRVR